MIVTVYVGLKFIISLLMDHMQCRQLIVPEIIYAERMLLRVSYYFLIWKGKRKSEKEKYRREPIYKGTYRIVTFVN